MKTQLENKPITSSCPRCKGLVVDDAFLCETSYWIGGLRCVNCGWVKLQEKVINYAFKKKAGRVDKLDELELYRTRSRGTKRGSYNIQHKSILG